MAKLRRRSASLQIGASKRPSRMAVAYADALSRVLKRAPNGITSNETFEDDGAIINRHACKLGCEGLVSKRLGSPYTSGRSLH